jgi:uncharacterized protein
MTGHRFTTGRGWRGWAAALAIALCCSLSSIAAQQSAPMPVLKDEPVNDFARIIDAESRAELERRITALKQGTGDIVFVVTVPTFQPYADIKEYAVKMFENGGRGLGDRAKDNGLLIVVAVNDRKVGIEVGYQLEPFITDGFSGETIREYIAPPFRKGQYGQGLVAGTTRIINRIAEQRGVNLTEVPATPAPVTTQQRRSGSRFPVGLAIFIVILILRLMAGRTRRRRYWGGGPWSGWNSGVGPFGGGGFGGFGGGFGGFGGGGGGGGGGGFGGFGGGRSGGGGASGGW